MKYFHDQGKEIFTSVGWGNNSLMLWHWWTHCENVPGPKVKSRALYSDASASDQQYLLDYFILSHRICSTGVASHWSDFLFGIVAGIATAVV
jgi:hypothetical protein